MIEWAKTHVCIGGWIVSPNDEDEHYISPKRVADLDHLNTRTCMFFKDWEDFLQRGRNLDRDEIMIHVPSTLGHYSPPGRHYRD